LSASKDSAIFRRYTGCVKIYPKQFALNCLAVSAAMTLVGCASTGQSKAALNAELPITTPQAWIEQHTNPTPALQQLDLFNDPTLKSLIDEAMGGNFDLASAKQRLIAANATAVGAKGLLLPSFDLNGTGARSRNVSIQAGLPVHAHNTNFGLNASVAWEADLWGKLSAEKQATVLDARATEADFYATQLSLKANVARAWFNAIAALQQLELALETGKSFADSANIIEENVRSGVGNALDLHLVRANAANARRSADAAEANFDNAVRQLEVLLGRYPAASLKISSRFPSLQITPAKGVPVEVLTRRPDLQAAANRVSAQSARDHATQKNWLPSLSFSGSAGTSTSKLSDLFDLDWLVWNIADQITAPLFRGGRLKAQRKASQANLNAAVNQYASQALTAFQEVETALFAEASLRSQLASASLTVNQLDAAEEIANEQYRNGLITITSLLDTQRRALDARSSHISVKRQSFLNRINLLLALGGGVEKPRP
jgi:NodT family efflux transporter outer membrane factor (OMF) lipoprotein